jgi:hypothetical protein
MHAMPLLLAAAALVTSSIAGASPCDSLDAARWLLGDWIASDGDKVFAESWQAASPRTFEGLGTTTARSGAASSDSEALRLVEMAGEVFYVAKVKHNPYPVSFRLDDCSTTRLVFENPAHDFPRKLVYTRSDDGTMTVAVSDGADQGFTLHFRRPENR